MNTEVLKKIGLSDGEIKVYIALLEIGATTINNIHEKVSIDRRNIYDILNKLIEKGLVSYIEENGKRTFKNTDPKKILSYIAEKKSELIELEKEAEKIIPLMQTLNNMEKEELFAEIFRGNEGLKASWNDMLNYDAIYWIGSGNYVPEKFPAFWKDWNARRAQKNIRSLHLFRHEKKREVNKKLVKEYKFLPKEFSGNATVTAIYGDKVSQMLFGKNILVFVIKSKELAENYKKYHEYLWKNVAKK